MLPETLGCHSGAWSVNRRLTATPCAHQTNSKSHHHSSCSASSLPPTSMGSHSGDPPQSVISQSSAKREAIEEMQRKGKRHTIVWCPFFLLAYMLTERMDTSGHKWAKVFFHRGSSALCCGMAQHGSAVHNGVTSLDALPCRLPCALHCNAVPLSTARCSPTTHRDVNAHTLFQVWKNVSLHSVY